jgi:hypothetical protein
MEGPEKQYSADVDLWLDCGHHGKVQLTHASATFVIAAVAVCLPACLATIILTVDGQKYERPVKLVGGMSPNSREAMVLSDDHISPF